jgi:hypothetical protein
MTGSRILLRITAVGIQVFLLSCASLKKPINTEPLNVDCPMVIESKDREFLPLDSIRADTLLTSRYSLSSLILANAFGVLDDLAEYENLRGKERLGGGDVSLGMERMVKERELDNTLDLAALELETVTNFIDCQGLALAKIKTRVAEGNDRTNRSFTTAAILAGAVSSVLVAGVLVSGDKSLKEGNATDWIGVAGGTAATYLAVSSTLVNRRAAIKHQQNVVQAIWTGNNGAGIFPSGTWYLLNTGYLVDSTDRTFREYIIDVWNQPPILLGAEENQPHLSALLGSVGTYDEEMLQRRLDMLEEIETAIDRINHLLYRLNIEME